MLSNISKACILYSTTGSLTIGRKTDALRRVPMSSI